MNMYTCIFFGDVPLNFVRFMDFISSCIFCVCSINVCSENYKDIFFKNLQKARETKTGDALKEVQYIQTWRVLIINGCVFAIVIAGVAQASADDQQ